MFKRAAKKVVVVNVAVKNFRTPAQVGYAAWSHHRDMRFCEPKARFGLAVNSMDDEERHWYSTLYIQTSWRRWKGYQELLRLRRQQHIIAQNNLLEQQKVNASEAENQELNYENEKTEEKCKQLWELCGFHHKLFITYIEYKVLILEMIKAQLPRSQLRRMDKQAGNYTFSYDGKTYSKKILRMMTDNRVRKDMGDDSSFNFRYFFKCMLSFIEEWCPYARVYTSYVLKFFEDVIETLKSRARDKSWLTKAVGSKSTPKQQKTDVENLEGDAVINKQVAGEDLHPAMWMRKFIMGDAVSAQMLEVYRSSGQKASESRMAQVKLREERLKKRTLSVWMEGAPLESDGPGGAGGGAWAAIRKNKRASFIAVGTLGHDSDAAAAALERAKAWATDNTQDEASAAMRQTAEEQKKATEEQSEKVRKRWRKSIRKVMMQVMVARRFSSVAKAALDGAKIRRKFNEYEPWMRWGLTISKMDKTEIRDYAAIVLQAFFRRILALNRVKLMKLSRELETADTIVDTQQKIAELDATQAEKRSDGLTSRDASWDLWHSCGFDRKHCITWVEYKVLMTELIKAQLPKHEVDKFDIPSLNHSFYFEGRTYSEKIVKSITKQYHRNDLGEDPAMGFDKFHDCLMRFVEHWTPFNALYTSQILNFFAKVLETLRNRAKRPAWLMKAVGVRYLQTAPSKQDLKPGGQDSKKAVDLHPAVWMRKFLLGDVISEDMVELYILSGKKAIQNHSKNLVDSGSERGGGGGGGGGGSPQLKVRKAHDLTRWEHSRDQATSWGTRTPSDRSPASTPPGSPKAEQRPLLRSNSRAESPLGKPAVGRSPFEESRPKPHEDAGTKPRSRSGSGISAKAADYVEEHVRREQRQRELEAEQSLRKFDEALDRQAAEADEEMEGVAARQVREQAVASWAKDQQIAKSATQLNEKLFQEDFELGRMSAHLAAGLKEDKQLPDGRTDEWKEPSDTKPKRRKSKLIRHSKITYQKDSTPVPLVEEGNDETDGQNKRSSRKFDTERFPRNSTEFPSNTPPVTAEPSFHVNPPDIKPEVSRKDSLVSRQDSLLSRSPTPRQGIESRSPSASHQPYHLPFPIIGHQENLHQQENQAWDAAFAFKEDGGERVPSLGEGECVENLTIFSTHDDEHNWTPRSAREAEVKTVPGQAAPARPKKMVSHKLLTIEVESLSHSVSPSGLPSRAAPLRSVGGAGAVPPTRGPRPNNLPGRQRRPIPSQPDSHQPQRADIPHFPQAAERTSVVTQKGAVGTWGAGDFGGHSYPPSPQDVHIPRPIPIHSESGTVHTVVPRRPLRPPPPPSPPHSSSTSRPQSSSNSPRCTSPRTHTPPGVGGGANRPPNSKNHGRVSNRTFSGSRGSRNLGRTLEATVHPYQGMKHSLASWGKRVRSTPKFNFNSQKSDSVHADKAMRGISSGGGAAAAVDPNLTVVSVPPPRACDSLARSMSSLSGDENCGANDQIDSNQVYQTDVQSNEDGGSWRKSDGQDFSQDLNSCGYSEGSAHSWEQIRPSTCERVENMSGESEEMQPFLGGPAFSAEDLLNLTAAKQRPHTRGWERGLFDTSYSAGPFCNPNMEVEKPVFRLTLRSALRREQIKRHSRSIFSNVAYQSVDCRVKIKEVLTKRGGSLDRQLLPRGSRKAAPPKPRSGPFQHPHSFTDGESIVTALPSIRTNEAPVKLTGLPQLLSVRKPGA